MEPLKDIRQVRAICMLWTHRSFVGTTRKRSPYGTGLSGCVNLEHTIYNICIYQVSSLSLSLCPSLYLSSVNSPLLTAWWSRASRACSVGMAKKVKPRKKGSWSFQHIYLWVCVGTGRPTLKGYIRFITVYA